MTPQQIAQHELLHIFGLAVALVEAGAEKSLFESLRMVVFLDEDDGRVGLEHHAELHPSVQARVLSLAAVAPLAGIADGHVKLIGTHPSDLLAKQRVSVTQACLSGEDLDHASNFDGPPLLPCLVVRAVAVLNDGLRLSGRQALTKALRSVTREDAGAVRLSAFCPFDRASRALEKARAELHQRTPA